MTRKPFGPFSLALALAASLLLPVRAPASTGGGVERVILFERSLTGGHAASRKNLRDALTRLSAAHGFRLQTTSAPADITAENLATAQVFILGNGDGDALPPGPARLAVEEFVREQGKGMLVVHAGSAFVREWDFLAQGIAQEYAWHAPSTTRGSVYADTGTSTDRAHGLNHPIGKAIFEGLPARAELVEEFYGFRASPRGAPGVTVLLSLDESSAWPALPAAMGDHPLVWVRSMGQGQVLTHTLGHNRGAWTGADSLGQRLLWNEISYLAQASACGGALCKGAAPALRPIDVFAGRRSIVLQLPATGTHRVSVARVNGAEVYEKTVAGGQRLVIPLRPSSYIVRVTGENGETLTRRVAVP